MDGVTEIEYVQQKQPVKLSHPGHFDATKPFMFNGQLVYPVPPGALPISMMGNQSNFSMHPGLHGQPLMPMPLPKLPHHAPDMPMMPPAHNGRRSGYTMLSAADITKSQIQGLRNHLSQIEHQLANNKLNIDEGFLKKQKQDFTTSIEVMEALLAKQTAQEEISDKTAVKVSEPLSSKDASEMQNVAIKKLKSKLTANAPAFQPRSMGGAPYVVSPNAVSSFPAPTQPLVVQSHPVAAPDEAEDSLLNYCQLDWNKVGTKDGQTIPGLPKASTLYVPASGTQEPLSSLKRSNTFHGHSMSIDSQAVPIIAPNAQPYLVGTYPSYMTGRETRPFNYQYARPLTEAENSARQLYWGQAPRPAQSGLPKFDGKDFYPPSPVKANSRPSTSHEATMPLRTRHSTPLPHNFEDLFTVSDAQVLESPSPSRQMHGSANEGADSHKGEIASPSYQRKQGPLGRPTHGHQHTDSYSHLFIEPSTMSHGSPKTPENAKTAASSHMPSGMTYVASSAQETLVNDDEDDYSDSDSDSVSGVAQGGAPLNLPTKIGFAGRVSSFTKSVMYCHSSVVYANLQYRPEQQTHFLHNMLQNTSRGSAATSSGKAPSTPAQGNLSGYRGTAAVSLAPTMSNVPAASGVMSFGSRKDFSKTQSASSFLPENRPLFERGNDRFTESMDAMSYMRHLAQKSSSNGSKDGKESSTTGWV